MTAEPDQEKADDTHRLKTPAPRERKRETDRQTETERDRETDTETGRQTDREAKLETTHLDFPLLRFEGSD